MFRELRDVEPHEAVLFPPWAMRSATKGPGGRAVTGGQAGGRSYQTVPAMEAQRPACLAIATG